MNCCCRFGAAVSGEYPEGPCPRCPTHTELPGDPRDTCRRHRQEDAADLIERQQVKIEALQILLVAAVSPKDPTRLGEPNTSPNRHAGIIERQQAEIERLRQGIARCCVGWEDYPPNKDRDAIVTVLTQLLLPKEGTA
jgi:hypothetical protein